MSDTIIHICSYNSILIRTKIDVDKGVNDKNMKYKQQNENEINKSIIFQYTFCDLKIITTVLPLSIAVFDLRYCKTG